VHRLGRTGRIGKHGSGILVLLPFEQLSRALISGPKHQLLAAPNLDDSGTRDALQKMEGLREDKTYIANAQAAYLAFVAYYVANPSRASLEQIEAAAETLAMSMGLSELPELPTKLQDALQNNR
jgi:superfamily II DNA/RNA helicase